MEAFATYLGESDSKAQSGGISGTGESSDESLERVADIARESIVVHSRGGCLFRSFFGRVGSLGGLEVSNQLGRVLDSSRGIGMPDLAEDWQYLSRHGCCSSDWEGRCRAWDKRRHVRAPMLPWGEGHS